MVGMLTPQDKAAIRDMAERNAAARLEGNELSTQTAELTKKTEGTTAKQTPTKCRDHSLEPSDKLVDQVLGAYRSSGPADLALKLVQRMGYATLEAYDTAARRAERFVRSNPDGKRRMPNHIRDKFVLKRMVELCVEKRYGGQAQAVAS